MDVITEKTTSTITITCTDENGTPVTPMSLTYSIYDVKSGTAIIETETITPTSPNHDLVISSEDNRILDSNNKEETRVITTSWLYDGDKKENAEYYYKIENLKHIT